jgi:uncharacterized protein
MIPFIDSSVITKRYIKEKGSEAVNDLFVSSESIYVSSISFPEVISALCRLQREGKISGAQYHKIKNLFIQDFEDFDICEMIPQVIAQSTHLLEKYPLRAMDALHLASALEIQAEIFISSDIRQLLAAKKLKLKSYTDLKIGVMGSSHGATN